MRFIYELRQKRQFGFLMKKLLLFSAAMALSACASIQNTVERTAITTARADFPQFSATEKLAESELPQSVDHIALDQFLETYLVTTPASNTLSQGASLIRYQDVSAADKQALVDYIDRLQAIKVSALERNEQLAFWINLYNAKTIDVVLDHYPVRSIRDINLGGGLFAVFTGGPWKAKIVKVNGQALSLDDIEHGLLRGADDFDEPRIHFAVNCASVGCPMLREEAYVDARLDAQLEEQTRRFLSDRSRNRYNPQNNTLEVSEIYKWFSEDWTSGYRGFEGKNQAMQSREQFFATYATLLADNPNQQQAITGRKAGISHLDYDWALNVAKK